MPPRPQAMQIISHVLANWLSMVVKKVISKLQNAIVKEWQILNSMLIANKCLDSRLKLGDSGLVGKLAMEKAYD